MKQRRIRSGLRDAVLTAAMICCLMVQIYAVGLFAGASAAVEDPLLASGQVICTQAGVTVLAPSSPVGHGQHQGTECLKHCLSLASGGLLTPLVHLLMPTDRVLVVAGIARNQVDGTSSGTSPGRGPRAPPIFTV